MLCVRTVCNIHPDISHRSLFWAHSLAFTPPLPHPRRWLDVGSTVRRRRSTHACIRHQLRSQAYTPPIYGNQYRPGSQSEELPLSCSTMRSCSDCRLILLLDLLPDHHALASKICVARGTPLRHARNRRQTHSFRNSLVISCANEPPRHHQRRPSGVVYSSLPASQSAF